jgi:small-conductance mechanosensitive channel
MISGRPALARIFINGAAETLAIALILIYYANWLDQLIDFIKTRPYTQRLGNNKAELYEYFEKFRGRIYALLFFLFVVAFLRDFNLLAGVKDSVTEFFLSVRKVGDLEYTMSGIAMFILVIFISTKLSSTIKFLTEDKSYFKSQKRTANISVMTRFFLVTGGFVLALLVSGIPLDQITIILGALSVGIGFGLQNVVNNLISGLILIFERPIQSGDLVELQTYTGVVKDISIRSSVIRTYDGAEVIVPNGNLISQEVINWTLSNQHRRIEILVGVAYGSDTEKVAEILKEPILAHDRALKIPQPMVLFNGFGDSSLNFRCLFWTADIDNWLRTKSEVTHAIYQALNDNGIEIPFPQRDLHIRSWDEGAGLPNSRIEGKSASDNEKDPQE